jgi:dihydroorotate dehydrogenase (NAD+) catalytic subunit
MGGVSTGRDALDLVAAGATAVALGTVCFSDPDAPARVRAELAAELRDRGYASAGDACGASHTSQGELESLAEKTPAK